MKRNLFFILIAALLLAPWPVVYAFDTANASTADLTVVPADTANAPQINAYGNAVGSVKPGELFQVNMTGTPADTPCKLLITNIDELMPDYRFMNLKIGVYSKDTATDEWKELMTSTGEKLPDIYISMFTGIAEFTLPGGGLYKITVDRGCFYTYVITPGAKIAAPVFYLTSNS